MRKLFALLALTACYFIAVSGVAHASEGGPPTAVATVTCTTITIDPEPGEGVTFTGTIGNTQVSAPGVPVTGTHTSTADIATLTTATGPIAYEITPQWVIAPNPYGVTSGAGVTVTGTLTCHEAPTSTSTTSTTVTSSTTVCSEPRGCCLQDCGETTTIGAVTSTLPPGPLPRTGGSSSALAGVGVVAVLAGLAAIVGPRRRRA